MVIHIKCGIDKLLFGMKQKDVEAIYGKPDRQFEDEDQNIVLVYNKLKWRLTLYEDEDFRLGYIISSNPELILFDKKIINRDVSDVKDELLSKHFKSWEKDKFDLAENYFNEDHWLVLGTEFESIIKIEIGAVINNKDEFDWKY